MSDYGEANLRKVASLHELLRLQRDDNTALRGTIGRLEAELEWQQDNDSELVDRLQEQWDRVRDANVVLRGTIRRLEDTIEALLGYTECGCGEDEEGDYGQCVPCHIKSEGIYP